MCWHLCSHTIIFVKLHKFSFLNELYLVWTVFKLPNIGVGDPAHDPDVSKSLIR